MDSTEQSQLRAHFEDLLKVLELERAALTAHDGAALESICADKENLCRMISEKLSAAPEFVAQLHQVRAASADQLPTLEIDADHKSLIDLATQARDSNLVNGKILHRSQQSVREILGILSGKSLDGLYGQSGQQTAAPDSGNNAIAQA